MHLGTASAQGSSKRATDRTMPTQKTRTSSSYKKILGHGSRKVQAQEEEQQGLTKIGTCLTSVGKQTNDSHGLTILNSTREELETNMVAIISIRAHAITDPDQVSAIGEDKGPTPLLDQTTWDGNPALSGKPHCTRTGRHRMVTTTGTTTVNPHKI
jgi:hypothetical protein